MKEKRDALETKVGKAKDEILRLVAERDSKTEPIYEEKRKLSDRIDAIEKPYDDSIWAIKKQKREDEDELSSITKKIQLESWKGRVPKDKDEAKVWFNLHSTSLLGLGSTLYSVHILRAPKVKSAKGYTVIAAADYNERPDNKVYVVFGPKGGVFAFMTMRPARHVGDYTTVLKVKIKGKDVRDEIGLQGWGAKKPLQTFMAAVEAAIAKK